MKKILLLLAFSFTLLFASVGKITIVSGDVVLTKAGKSTKVVSGSTLDEKDQVSTKAGASAQIVFKDGTAISLGASSIFRVDEYLYDEASSKGSAKFGVSEGAFRAITGKIGKVAPDKFKLDTRTATIGIRGTRFLGMIPKTGPETIACTKGAISVTLIAPPQLPGMPAPKAVAVDVKAGQMTTVSVDKVEAPKAFTPAEIKHLENATTGEVKKSDTTQPVSTGGVVSAGNTGSVDAVGVVSGVGDTVGGVTGTVSTINDGAVVDKVISGTYSSMSQLIDTIVTEVINTIPSGFRSYVDSAIAGNISGLTLATTDEIQVLMNSKAVYEYSGGTTSGYLSNGTPLSGNSSFTMSFGAANPLSGSVYMSDGGSNVVSLTTSVSAADSTGVVSKMTGTINGVGVTNAGLTGKFYTNGNVLAGNVVASNGSIGVVGVYKGYTPGHVP